MKKSIILLTLLLTVTTSWACRECQINSGDFEEYTYKGNVKTVHKVSRSIYKDKHGNKKMEKDTSNSWYLIFDQQKECMLMESKTCDPRLYAFKKYERFNGERKLVEFKMIRLREERPVRDDKYIYSENGILQEEQHLKSKILYNPQGKEQYRISYKSPKEISEYRYTYYDQNGNDTAIVILDKEQKPLHRTKKRYNQWGKLTEEYYDDTLVSYHKYDSIGRLVADSSAYDLESNAEDVEIPGLSDYYIMSLETLTGPISKISLIRTYEYGERSLKTNYFFADKKSIEHTEEVEKRNEKNQKIEWKYTHYDADGNESSSYLERYENGDTIGPIETLKYKNGKLFESHKREESITKNEKIITTIDWKEGKADTLQTVTKFDKKGNILSIVKYENSRKKSQTLYTYNKRGQLLSIVSEDGYIKVDDLWLDVDKIEYRYDKRHNLVKEITSQEGKILRRLTHHYDDKNCLIATDIEEDMNRDGKLRFMSTTKYDKMGNAIEIDYGLSIYYITYTYYEE